MSTRMTALLSPSHLFPRTLSSNIASFHNHTCSKPTRHSLMRGISATEPIITRQRLFPRVSQNKMKLAGDRRIRHLMHAASRRVGTKQTLRIMPLGGSVTYGSEPSDGNGYRKILQGILVSDGYVVDMVGSRKAGSMENNANEGWRGFRIEQVTKKAKISAPSFSPNLFTVNVGSNDCIQNFEIETAGKRMSDMLEYLWAASSHSTIVLSTLLLNLDRKVESRVLCINEQLRDLANVKAAEGRKIILVDMHGPDGPQIGDLADGTHPDDIGYAKMATIWHRGILEAAHKDFIQDPR